MQFPLLLASTLLAITSTEAAYPYGSNFHLACANYTIDVHLFIRGECKLNSNRRQDKPFGDPEHPGWRATSLDLNKCMWYDPSETTLQWIAPFCNMGLVDTPPDLRNHSGRVSFFFFFFACPFQLHFHFWFMSLDKVWIHERSLTHFPFLANRPPSSKTSATTATCRHPRRDREPKTLLIPYLESAC